jgi:hypothetical protein
MGKARPIDPLLDFQRTPSRSVIINPFAFPGVGGGSGFVLLSHTGGGSTNTNSVTTSGIDTTGANLLVAVLADYSSSGTPTITDSLGNSWTVSSATTSAPNPRCRIAHCVPTSTGAAHTFTSSGTATYPSIAVLAFSGAHASPLDQENGASGNGVTSQQAGSVTPSQNDELIIAGIGLGNSSVTASISAGYTITDQVTFNGSQHFQVVAAYKIQTSAAAENPTWSWSGGLFAAARIATFKAA